MAGITLRQATTIVETALQKGRETGCAPLAVAVLDAGGHLKAFAREDGAGILRPQIALGKAWGALGMGVGSRAFAKRLADNPQQHSFFTALNAMSDGRVVPVPGGVLVRDAADAVIGAVGISGDVSDTIGRIVSGNPAGNPALNVGGLPPSPPPPAPQPNRLMLVNTTAKTIPAKRLNGVFPPFDIR